MKYAKELLERPETREKDEARLAGWREADRSWREQYEEAEERDALFTTISGIPVKPLYTPLDGAERDDLSELGFPGEYPYTRGIHRTMYRGRMWTIRQFAGFATPAETNERYHYLLEQGQHGLSVAFDMPTLMGYDSDHARSEGEVGVCGVAVNSLEDMEILFRGIPLDEVSTSMTINGPALILLAMYIAVAEKEGVPKEKLRGTVQNDIFKEYIAQKEWIFPPEPSVRLVVDSIEYCTKHMPQWNPVSISGYHIREAGSTAGQELAFTLADGFTYVEAALERALDIDDFAPRLSFFFNAHNDFFEEIAKYRAARRIWAKAMRETYGAQSPRSWLLRFHTQTAGCSLTAQQPENNIVRVAYQALAAVLGGTQSLHANAMDETLALPSEKAALIALRTQQVLAHETEVANTIDPLGGSYYIEALTDRLEAEANEYFRQIEGLGGVIPAIEAGFFQREIARAAYRYQQEVEAADRIIVGINEFVHESEELEIPILRIEPEVERQQAARVRALRDRRDSMKVEQSLKALEGAARTGENVMEPLLDCVRAYATLGEMVEVLKGVYGTWTEPSIL